WQARAVAGGSGKPGEIVATGREGITVACGSGLLRIEMVQKPGGRKLSAADFLAGNNLQPGEYLAAMNHPYRHD
ncbi:MAG: methionyl-tRNA formyltransferase, partial [Pseudomonadota bacterium]